MATVVGVLLAIFLLPRSWGVAAAVGGLTIDLVETWLWIRLSRRRQAVTGAEGLIGRVAVVVDPCRPDGRVRVHGELWAARCETGAEPGDDVRVVRIDGLTLEVERVR